MLLTDDDILSKKVEVWPLSFMLFRYQYYSDAVALCISRLFNSVPLSINRLFNTGLSFTSKLFTTFLALSSRLFNAAPLESQ